MNGVSVVILLAFLALLVIFHIVVFLHHVFALPLLASEFGLLAFFLFASYPLLLESLEELFPELVFGADSVPLEADSFGLFGDL